MSDDFLALSPNLPNLFKGANPDQQLLQQQVDRGDAFKAGVPTDANGAPDYSAMAKTLLQKGDYANAGNLLGVGIQQQGIALASRAANDLQNGTIGGGVAPAAPVAGSVVPAPSTKGANADVVNGIRSIFAAKGIDPNVSLAVAGAEGLRGFDPGGNANPGDDGSSFGPFQLHYGNVAGGPNSGPGLGDEFTKATGLDARDPSTWRQQAEFVANHVAKNGWGAFHGAARLGIAPMAGIGAQPAPGAPQVAQQDGSAPAPQAVAAADGVPLPPRKPAAFGGAPDQVASSDDDVSGAHPYAQVGMPGGPGNGPAAPQASADPALPVEAAGQVAGPGVPSQPQQPTPPAASQSDAVAIDPTMGGLLKGQWVGNPGGYVAALRAEQIRLSAFAPKAADAYGKQADAIERGIERNNIVTPEMKNYQIAKQQGYSGTMMQFAADGPAQAEAAKIAASATPSALRAQGQKAEATAAGTAQGQAGSELVATQPVPGGPTVYQTKADILAAKDPVVSKQPAFIAQQQEALGKAQNEMVGQLQQRQVAHERIDAMTNLLESFQSGAGADQKAAAVAAVRALGIPLPDSATANPAAVEQFAKNATANIFSQAKALGGKILVSELSGLQKSNANPNMQPASNAAILAQQKGLLSWQDAHDQAFFDWHQQNPNAYDASSFEQQWVKDNPPSKFVQAAKLNIAPLGVPLPPKAQLVDGQAYMIKGQKARWSATANGFVPVGAAGQ